MIKNVLLYYKKNSLFDIKIFVYALYIIHSIRYKYICNKT